MITDSRGITYKLILFIFLAGNLFAQEVSFPAGMFAGLGPELNGYTRSGHAFGGSLQLGMDLNESFSFGQKTGFFTDFESVRVLELLFFFRYYLPWLHFPSTEDGPFIQAEAGTALSIEYGYHIYDEVFPSFLGGAALGWRFNFPQNGSSYFWYIEPAARLGYPYIWGFVITAGIRFKARNSEQVTVNNEEREEIDKQIIQSNEQITNSREQIESAPVNTSWQVLTFVNVNGTEEHILVVKDYDGRLRIQTASVIFRADHADFTGLNAAILDSNADTFRRVAQTLNAYKDYRILIEGHANPTTPEGEEREAEEPSLRQLSEERAQRVAEELTVLGIDRRRFSIAGMGSSKSIVSYNDKDNTWKNRRVEFYLINE